METFTQRHTNYFSDAHLVPLHKHLYKYKYMKTFKYKLLHKNIQITFSDAHLAPLHKHLYKYKYMKTNYFI